MPNPINRPAAAEYGPYYQRYLDLIPDANALPVLQSQAAQFEAFVQQVPAQKWGYAYGPDKWTVAQVLGHIVDTERIYTYRALSMARGEQQPILGFDENKYVVQAYFNSYTPAQMVAEFNAVRTAFVALYEHLHPSTLNRTGQANGMALSAGAIAFIMAGHMVHHLNIIKERYL